MENDDTTRVPMPYPKNNVELFMGLVLTFADLCNIKKIPELRHQVELLSRAAEEYVWKKNHGGNPFREGEEKRRFIASFKNRFRVSMEFDYPNVISPAEQNMIGNLINGKLKDKHIDSDTYLQWFFDDFLERKQTFKPPTLKLACSLMVWSDFLYQSKDLLKDKKDQALQESEAVDLINRAREILRSVDDIKVKTKISELVKTFGNGGIVFTDFKRQILDFERLSGQDQGNQGNQGK